MSSKNYVISENQSAAIKSFTLNLIESIEKLIETQSTVSIGLSGGSFIKLFTAEVPSHKARFEAVHDKLKFFFCDERFVKFDSPDSTYAEFVKNNFFACLNIASENVFKIKEDSTNVDECALDYEQRISSLMNKDNGFDILILGMGPDGHTCSLFPGHDLFLDSSNQTRVVLPISDSPKPPPQRVTLTLNYVNNSKNLFFFACGAGKANMLKRILVDKDLSLPCANVLPKSGVLKWFVDKDAARLLE